ncbi:hypothetical protein Tco_0351611 [Tanacetum coccineum]
MMSVLGQLAVASDTGKLQAKRGSWKDSKDRESGRATNRSSNNGDTKPRDVVESDLKQSSNKRRSFRETKIPVDDKSATEVTKLSVNGERSERKEERGKPQEKAQVDRHDRHRTEMRRTNYQSRDRYGGGGDGGFGVSFRGRDRFNGRQGHSGGQADKWKHDLYHEANKSPNSKNEEDQIAKVSAASSQPWVAETPTWSCGVMNPPPQTRQGDDNWQRVTGSYFGACVSSWRASEVVSVLPFFVAGLYECGGGGLGSSFRETDRFSERQGQSGARAYKWKHDYYDDAKKSPTSKNEEEQIAKVEALLA